METENNNGNSDSAETGIRKILSKKIIVGLVVLIVILGGGFYAFRSLGFLSGKGSGHEIASQSSDTHTKSGDIKVKTTDHEKKHTEIKHEEESKPEAPSHSVEPANTHEKKEISHFVSSTPIDNRKPIGVAFVEAAIAPLQKQLDSFYGWRPNDLIEFTDNVNNYQLGVLEVTRRTAEVLAEKLSRPGAAASFDKHLEKARSRFMNQADKWWFPWPESEYQSGLEELEAYKEKLENGTAGFYSRTDNLIPLLAAYEQLLGSCDENLVKINEDSGRQVSFFMADDYFYQAQGVASAIHEILVAVQKDFAQTISTRDGMNSLHHAIESCEHAIEVKPWIILDSDLNGIFANHRSNLAGPISHARFYIGLLIKTLST